MRIQETLFSQIKSTSGSYVCKLLSWKYTLCHYKKHIFAYFRETDHRLITILFCLSIKKICITQPVGPTKYIHQMSVGFYVELFSEVTSSLTNKKLDRNSMAS